MRNVIVLASLLALSGCGLFGDDVASCDEVKPYQGSAEVPPLKVPEGVDAPNTRGALKIPDVKPSPKPRDPTRCLADPPAYIPKPPAQPPAEAPANAPPTG
ncbi:MAG: hypothetical protein IT483_08915 [Gammaproteobacteria bacterium]|nr:hypothetical protein [Gammaproteobacteria bacterium]